MDLGSHQAHKIVLRIPWLGSPPWLFKALLDSPVMPFEDVPSVANFSITGECRIRVSDGHIHIVPLDTLGLGYLW